MRFEEIKKFWFERIPDKKSGAGRGSLGCALFSKPTCILEVVRTDGTLVYEKGQKGLSCILFMTNAHD